MAIYLPKIMRIGAGASMELPAVLRQLGLKRPMIVTDSFMLSSGTASPIIAALKRENVPHSVFDGCVPDPTSKVVAEGVAAYLQDPVGDRCDCVVGVGGGSPMDTAKAIAISVALDKGSSLRQFKPPSEPPKGLPIIAVPTTAGTGSEATKVSVVTDVDTLEKMPLNGLSLLPEVALVDYTLTLSCPRRLTADTGIDALCHALEAYVSRKHNSFSDSQALPVMATIPMYLRRACSDPGDREAREKLMFASTQAGIAFSNSSVTLIHGMSRPIGALFHVPHGMSNAMLLPSITAFSLEGDASRYAEASRTMGFADSSDSTVRAGSLLLDGLQRLCSDLEVPTLEEFGVPRDEYFNSIKTMAEQALASGSPANNPRLSTPEQLHALYTQLWA